jgi:hypothetical protein
MWPMGSDAFIALGELIPASTQPDGDLGAELDAYEDPPMDAALECRPVSLRVLKETYFVQIRSHTAAR